MTMVHLIQLKTNKWVQCGLMVTEVARVRFSVWEPFVNILTSLSEWASQCDQIGWFLQVLGNKLSHKSSPNILVTFWAISNNVTIM